MNLWEKIQETYPELTNADFGQNGCIELRDEGDGVVYIAKWEYSKPLPEGMKVGKN